MNTVAIARNGGEQLPEHRQKQVEAGLATYQKMLAERDELDGKLSEACKTIAALTTQLDALKSVVNMMESSYKSAQLQMEERIATHQQQRDDAVTRTAKLEAVLANVYSILGSSIEQAT